VTVASELPTDSNCLLPSTETCRQILQVRAGDLLSTLLCNMKRITSDTKCGVCTGPSSTDGCSGASHGASGARPRLLLYSVDDSTLLALLTAMRSKSVMGSEGAWPDFASHIEVELWQTQVPKNGWLVRVSFNNRQQQLRRSQETMLLNEFEGVLYPYLVQGDGDSEALCKK